LHKLSHLKIDRSRAAAPHKRSKVIRPTSAANWQAPQHLAWRRSHRFLGG